MALSAIEIVWENVKRGAAEYAVDGIRPTFAQVQAEVGRWMYEAHVMPCPAEAVDFYANEFLRLIDAYAPAN